MGIFQVLRVVFVAAGNRTECGRDLSQFFEGCGIRSFCAERKASQEGSDQELLMFQAPCQACPQAMD
jgi:hypothetical protein